MANESKRAEEIVAELRKHTNQKNIDGMARFGITSKNAIGMSMPEMRGMAKKIGKDHLLAIALWKTDVYEARVLAALIDESEELTSSQMDAWASGFDSWAVCDVCCMELFWKSPLAYEKCLEWSKHKEEFVKRTAFSLMAVLAVHDKKSPDSRFEKLFSIIEREADDERNFVRKAVNWALRQIGKRSENLRVKALVVAKKIRTHDSKAARWIANDAIRELEGETAKKVAKIREKMRKKK